MADKLPWLLILLLVATLQPLSAEIRSLWVLPWSLNSPTKIDSMVESAVASHQTDLLVEVRYRSDALYQTNRKPDSYPNPEPRSHVLGEGRFDPLEYVLRKAHRQNLRVHAWVVVFNATPVDSVLISRNHIFRNHPDWITCTQDGERMLASEQYGYYIDPGIPEAQEYLLNVLSDLVSGYPELDGLHLDYIRYPNSSLGYHPISVERFDVYCKNHNLQWNQWRIKQITQFVEITRERMKELNPKLLLSAAVIANYDSAVRYYAQDWRDWLHRDLVDFAYPMAYQLDAQDFQRQLEVMKSLRRDSRIVVGLRAWDAGGNSLLPRANGTSYNLLDLAERINSVRKLDFAGIALFSYDGLLKDDAISHLARISYSERVLASQTALELVSGAVNPKRQYAADIKVSPTPTHYLLNLLIPEEGRWFWEVRDASDKVIYQRSRYYLKGLNDDYWNGILSDGEPIANGQYLFSVWREQDDHEYIIPVRLEGLK